MHVVVGSPWRDAVIRYLEPRSPYRPWTHAADVHENDGVLVVFDTEPVLVLTQVARVGADLDIEAAIAGLDRDWTCINAVPASQLGVDVPIAPTVLTGAEAVALTAAVEAQCFGARPEDRFGTSSLAAARALLESDGRCTGCDAPLPLDRADARESVDVRTAPDAEDWPAALCRSCSITLRDSGFTRFLDYRFVLHPACPRCGTDRSRRVTFGMPAGPFEEPPWETNHGCCVMDVQWECSKCRHEW